MRRALFAAICSLWNAHPWLLEKAGRLTWGEGAARDDAGKQTRIAWTIRQTEGGTTSYETGPAVVETINLEIEGYCDDADAADGLATTIEDWLDAQDIRTPEPFPTMEFRRPGPALVDEISTGLWIVNVPLTVMLSRQRRVPTT